MKILCHFADNSVGSFYVSDDPMTDADVGALFVTAQEEFGERPLYVTIG